MVGVVAVYCFQNGNMVSLKMTCLVTYTLLVMGSRHLYPFFVWAYPMNTHGSNSGDNFDLA